MKKILIKMMAMLLTIFLPFSSVFVKAESTGISSEESTGFSSEKELAILSYFNIIDKETSPDAELTKLDFILMLCKMLLKDTSPTAGGEKLFYDYEPTDPYAAEVEFAYKSGIISGDSEGFLRGNAKLKKTDAIVMTIRALDYEVVAQKNGGYPVGYTMAAKTLKLTQGLSGLYSDVITLREASKLVFNAMNVQGLTFYSKYNDNTYMEETDRTILSSLYKVSLVKGVVNANRYVSLPVGNGVLDDEISINGMRFKEGKTDATNLLGYYVEGYFLVDEYDNKVLIYADYSKNDVSRFNVRDCNYYKPGEISYYDEVTKKEVKHKISPLASTLVNFAPYKMSEALAFPVSGEFEVIDNDRDGVFDVVRVSSYEVFVLAGKNTDESILYNKNNTADYLDLSDYKAPVIKSSDGTKLEIENLEEGKTFFIQRNKDIKYLSMIELDNSASVTVGKVTEQDGSKIVIDKESDISYRVSPCYYSITSNPTIKIGETYLFLLDIFGDICAIKSDFVSNTLNYGYLVNFTRSFQGIDKTVQFKIFNTEGEFLILTAAKRVKTNLYGNIKAEELIQKNISDGIVMFGVNQEGKLNALDFPVSDATEGFRLVGETGAKSESLYKNQSGTIGGKILIDNNTTIFVVPDNKSEEEKFYIYKPGNMVHNNYYPYSKGYSSHTDSFASEAVVIPQESTAILTYNSSLLVVQNVSDYYDEETGEEGKQLNGYADGVYRELPVYSSLSLAYSYGGNSYTVAVGDVLQYVTDKSGKITNYSVLFSNAARAVLSGDNNKAFTSTERDDFGTIMQRIGNCFKFMHTGKNQMADDLYVIKSTTGLYEFDSSKKTVSKLSIIDYNQIESREDNPDSTATAYVRLIGSVPTVVVIYK